MTEPSQPTVARLPVPIAAYLLPFLVIALTGYELRDRTDRQTRPLLIAAMVVLVLLAAVGPLRAFDANERYPAARRVLLLALLPTMLLFSVCCAYLAAAGTHGPLGVYPSFVFVPGWLLFGLLVPFWANSPVIRTEEPLGGWKQAGSWKLLYSDPDDSALWVRMNPQNAYEAYRSATFTPNLGHRWGRAAMTTFVVLIAAMVVVLIIA